jgi:hypothetical protein
MRETHTYSLEMKPIFKVLAMYDHHLSTIQIIWSLPIFFFNNNNNERKVKKIMTHISLKQEIKSYTKVQHRLEKKQKNGLAILPKKKKTSEKNQKHNCLDK